MSPRPWWQRILQFLRECLCRHAWQHDEPFANFQFCPRCGATESLKTFRPDIMWMTPQEWDDICKWEKETKHEDLASRKSGGIKPPHRGL